jgi:hypothetical protein
MSTTSVVVAIHNGAISIDEYRGASYYKEDQGYLRIRLFQQELHKESEVHIPIGDKDPNVIIAYLQKKRDAYIESVKKSKTTEESVRYPNFDLGVPVTSGSVYILSVPIPCQFLPQQNQILSALSDAKKVEAMIQVLLNQQPQPEQHTSSESKQEDA